MLCSSQDALRGTGPVRNRAALVRMRPTVKNRIHALVEQRGHRCTHSDVFDKGGLRWLRGLELGALDRLMLKNHLDLVEDLADRLSGSTRR